jgi:hypothetical protein
MTVLLDGVQLNSRRLDNPCSKSTHNHSQFPYQTFTEHVPVCFTLPSPASWTNHYFTCVFWWENWYCIFQALIALVLTVTIPVGNSIGVRESARQLKYKFNLTNRNFPVASILYTSEAMNLPEKRTTWRRGEIRETGRIFHIEHYRLFSLLESNLMLSHSISCGQPAWII